MAEATDDVAVEVCQTNRRTMVDGKIWIEAVKLQSICMYLLSELVIMYVTF